MLKGGRWLLMGRCVWPVDKGLPSTESYSILLKSVFIKTEDPKSQLLQRSLYNGIMVMTVTGKEGIMLPMGRC